MRGARRIARNEHLTTTQLVVALDQILFEASRMERIVRDAPRERIASGDRHELRRRIAVLIEESDALMQWLTEMKLERPKN